MNSKGRRLVGHVEEVGKGGMQSWPLTFLYSNDNDYFSPKLSPLLLYLINSSRPILCQSVLKPVYLTHL